MKHVQRGHRVPQSRSALITLIFLAGITGADAWAVPIPTREIAPAFLPSMSIRVRIQTTDGNEALSVRGFDMKVRDVATAHELMQGSRLNEWSVTCRDGRVALKRGRERRVGGVEVSFATPAGFLSLDGKPHRDELHIRAGKGTACIVINELDLEKYLDGLVNGEFNSRWSEESIAAQVIAARTYALYQIREARRRNKPYDVESTIKDQVYRGTDHEDFLASRIVSRTRGMVLTEKKKTEPIKAFYHSTCGGRTELPRRVWGAEKRDIGVHKQVECPFCVSSPRFRWDLVMTDSEVKRAILDGVEERGVPSGWPADWRTVVAKWQLDEVSLRNHDIDRVTEVELSFTDGAIFSPTKRVLKASGTRFRGWVGVERIKSTIFDLRRTSDRRWVVSGRGYGHGVGLCQWGAKVMGEKGYTSAKILSHYYPAAMLRKLW
jgi:stage II sporulation protein D